MDRISSYDAKLLVDGVEVEGFTTDESKAVLIHGGRQIGKSTIALEWAKKEGLMSKQPVFKDKMSKSEMIKCLRQALISQGHTKSRAQELAKIHYKRYLGCQR